MLFHVEMTVRLPHDMPAAHAEQLKAREKEIAQGLPASFAVTQRLRTMAASLHRLVVASGALIDDATPPVKDRPEKDRVNE